MLIHSRCNAFIVITRMQRSNDIAQLAKENQVEDVCQSYIYIYEQPLQKKP